MADLEAIARKGAAIAMQVAGTAKTTATIHIKGAGGVYDPETDTTTSSTTNSTVEGVLYNLRQAQGFGPTAHSTEFLIEGVESPAALHEADTVTIDGKEWEIVEVQQVPTKAVVILGLR